MDSLRHFLKWVSAHRILSTVILVIVFASLTFVRIVKIRSQGVASAPLKRGDIIEAVYGIGTVMANRSFQIRPGVISTIQALYVKEGDVVHRGDRLLKIDQVIYRAPFDGTITFLPFKVNENVFPQVPALTLVDLSDRYLVVSLEQQGALRVRKGQSARMNFDTMREQSYDGVIQSVYSNESNFLARIDVSMLPPQVLPGMTADVAIAIREQKNVLLAPVAAVEEGKYLWVKKPPFPKKVEVKLGITDKDLAEVVSGDIHEGEQVIIRKKPGP